VDARPANSRPAANGEPRRPPLAADPRVRAWVARVILTATVYLVVMLVAGWRWALSAAVLYAVADVIYRSKTLQVIPPAARVTSAQRSTMRRLRMLRAAGYMALNRCQIPGTESIIDHLVVGPAGVFTLDSERLDSRLTLRAIGGMLYHGPTSMEARVDHAQEEARRAADLIGAELGQQLRVRPAMVIYGPQVPWVIMRLKGVDIFAGRQVSAYFRRRSKESAGHHIDPGQVNMVIAAAARALPPIR
jgi:hypothetical protein